MTKKINLRKMGKAVKNTGVKILSVPKKVGKVCSNAATRTAFKIYTTI